MTLAPPALAVEVPQQVVLSGAMRGLAIGVLAVGVILIYRSCRVINFALGELGALAAALFVRLTVNWHWDFYAALERFEEALHDHMHLENNVLFPRAGVLESNVKLHVAGPW